MPARRLCTVKSVLLHLSLRPPTRYPAFWSYSRWASYSKCPMAYFHANVLKIKVPFGNPEAMARGEDVHRKAESYLKDRTHGLPDELSNFANEFRNLKDAGASSEAGLTLTKDWQQTHAKDWNGAWLRLIADAEVLEDTECTTIDFKTGRPWDDHEQQAEVLAMGKLATHRHVVRVDVEFWYLDTGDVNHWSYTRRQFPSIKKRWVNRSEQMLNDRKFKPVSGSHCNRCPFRDTKKGGCTAWRT